MRFIGDMVFNHLHQSRFANAGIPIEHHDLPQAVLDLGPAFEQQGDSSALRPAR
jgi:hypothetical protein